MTSPLPTTQSLIQLTSHGLTAANFAEKEAPVPKISDSQLLIKVAFAGVNPVDAKHARGDFGAWTIGQTQGRECSGTVVAVGPAVREAGSFAVGDEVMAYCDGKEWAMVPGAFAQYVAVHSDLAAKKPHGVSLAQAAACPLAGLVAWECARVKVVPRPGDTVLVAGASGGVGTFLVQLCRASVGPNGKVIVTAGSDESAAYCTDVLGCGPADILRYRGKTVDGMVKEIAAITNKKMVQCAYDLFGQDMKRLCFRALCFDGRVATIVEEPPAGFAADGAELWDGPKSVAFAKSISISFIWLGGRVVLGDEGKDSAVLGERLAAVARVVKCDRAAAMETGGIAAPPVKVAGALSPATVASAVQVMDTGAAKGKLVIDCGGGNLLAVVDKPFLNCTYTGTVNEAGEPHGKGVQKFENGDVYDGEFQKGEKVGKGTYTWVQGDKYEGDFADLEVSGKGTYSSVDGRSYVGNFVACSELRGTAFMP